MSIHTAGRPKKCPHCGEWLVTPEQAKQQRKRFRKFILVWTTVFMLTFFGIIFIPGLLIAPDSDLDTYDWDEFDEYISNYIYIEVNKQHFYVNETTDDNMTVTVINYGDKNISWGDLELSITYADNINPTMSSNSNYAKFFQSINGRTYTAYRTGVYRFLEGDLPVLLSSSTYVFNVSVSLDKPGGYDGANYWLNYRIGSFSIGVHNLERS